MLHQNRLVQRKTRRSLVFLDNVFQDGREAGQTQLHALFFVTKMKRTGWLTGWLIASCPRPALITRPSLPKAWSLVTRATWQPWKYPKIIVFNGETHLFWGGAPPPQEASNLKAYTNRTSMKNYHPHSAFGCLSTFMLAPIHEAERSWLAEQAKKTDWRVHHPR